MLFNESTNGPVEYLSWNITFCLRYRGCLQFGIGPCSINFQRHNFEGNEIMKENILESLMSYSDDISGVFTKIDLNAASSEELLTVPGMSSKFASSIIEYRKK